MLFFYNPESNLLAPKCYFYNLTGYKCIGCGTQRAIHNLLHLRFVTSFKYNPILFFAIPYIVLLIYIQYFGGKIKFPRLYNTLTSAKAIYIVLAIMLLYWIFRNILGF